MPTGPFFPQRISRKKPTTVGGSINGSVIIPSINPLNLLLVFAII